MGSDVPKFNGLKHLRCPREAGGATCSTPGCLFGHRSDNQIPASNIASKIHALDGAADEDVDEDSRPPQKRQKLDFFTSHRHQQLTNNDDFSPSARQVNGSDPYDPLSPLTVGNLPKEPPKAVTPSHLKTTTTSSAQTHLLPKPELSTSRSSAALKHKQPNHTNKSALSPSVAGHAVSPPSPVTSKITASPKRELAAPPRKPEPLKAPQRKPEALNPRHITAAPAPHALRFQFLTLLKQELDRLNRAVLAKCDTDSELKPLVKSDQELTWIALDLEEKVATEQGPIYRNIMGHKVMSHKRLDVPTWLAQLKQEQSELRLRGASGARQKLAQTNPAAGNPVVIETGLTPGDEIQVLEKLLTPITNLEPYGYVATPPTLAQIAEAEQTVAWAGNWEQCDRCNTRFQVFPDRNIETGELTSAGACTHHPGRSYFPERPPGFTGLMNKKYRCCTQEVNESPGCATTERHVWKTSTPARLASLWNWVETPTNDSPDVRKAVAFDCEMGYTVRGMEVLRVTATSWPDGAEIIDVLVQPFGHILDLNSRYSGVFMEDLVNGVPWTKEWEAPPQKTGERKILRKVDSPKAARDLLFSIISPDTVLIGHGLENDLNAMRIVHPKIIDTILLYPHNKGLPIRNGLKFLMDKILRRRIQIDTGNGHDSAEDARAAGDLVRYQVQKRWKKLMLESGWQLVDGVLRKDTSKAAAMDLRSGEESTDSDSGGLKFAEEGSSEGGAKLTEELLEGASAQ